jgi:hypothetical protein
VTGSLAVQTYLNNSIAKVSMTTSDQKLNGGINCDHGGNPVSIQAYRVHKLITTNSKYVTLRSSEM